LRFDGSRYVAFCPTAEGLPSGALVKTKLLGGPGNFYHRRQFQLL